MLKKLNVQMYLAGEETNRPQELRFGMLREPPAPGFDHQVVVGRLFRRLDEHVRRHQIGTVVLSPIHVVLDVGNALVVQPDIVYVSTAREHICTDRIWGAPDITAGECFTG